MKMVKFPPCIGEGCKHCKGVTENFIRKAKEVHGEKYDYSLTKISCQDVEIPEDVLKNLI